jgi:hypothetical protein
MIRELDPAALLLAAPVGAHAAGEHAPADDCQHLEFVLEIVVEQRRFRGRGPRRDTAKEIEDAHGFAKAAELGLSPWRRAPPPRCR